MIELEEEMTPSITSVLRAIKLKEIQNLQHKLSLTAAEGKNRVLLLWMPEQIKPVASNKLLA